MSNGNGGNGNGGSAWIAVIAAVLGAVVGAIAAGLISFYVGKSQAKSASVDQANGAAAAYLAVFNVMQDDLDGMIQWQQKLAPTVSDQAWNVSINDLKSLGVVLRPVPLIWVELASQWLNHVFPANVKVGGDRSSQAHVDYVHNWRDLKRTDEIVRCAEIVLDQQVHPNLSLSGGDTQKAKCNKDFGINSPTFTVAFSRSWVQSRHATSLR